MTTKLEDELRNVYEKIESLNEKDFLDAEVAEPCLLRDINSNTFKAVQKSQEVFEEITYLLREKINSTLAYTDYKKEHMEIGKEAYDKVRLLCFEIKGILEGIGL